MSVTAWATRTRSGHESSFSLRFSGGRVWKRVCCGAVLAMVLILFVSSAWGDESANEAFKEANDLYLEGNYGRAVEIYERLVNRDHISHEDLYYNLGNAYFKLGKLGYAIYNYERTLKVEPDHERAAHNLDVARGVAKKRAGDKVVGAAGKPFWMRTVKLITPGALSIWFLVLWYLCFGLLISLFFLRRGVFRVLAISGSSLFGVAALVFGLLLAGRAHVERSWPQGIVLQKVVEVREGPRSNATSAFQIHYGLKVRLLESDMEWYRIRLANGLEGWVRRRTVGRL